MRDWIAAAVVRRSCACMGGGGDGVGWPLTSEVCSVLLLNYNIKVIHLDIVREKNNFFEGGGAS